MRLGLPPYYQNINVDTITIFLLIPDAPYPIPVATPVVLKGAERPESSFITFLTGLPHTVYRQDNHFDTLLRKMLTLPDAYKINFEATLQSPVS